jgi:hypothetical protein
MFSKRDTNLVPARPIAAVKQIRQRQDAPAIPLRAWLAVLDQGLVDADLQRTLPKLKAPTLGRSAALQARPEGAKRPQPGA